MSKAATAVRHAVVAAIGCAALVAMLRGCGSDPSIDQVPGGPDASDASSDAPKDAQTTLDALPEADVKDAAQDADAKDAYKPDVVPDGWEFYPDYDPQCTLWYAPSAELMPPPIAWEPCTSPIGPDGMVCRQMVVDWEPYTSEFPIHAVPTAFAKPGGTVLMQVGRLAKGGVATHILAEADGPVLQGLIAVDRSCSLGTNPMDGEHVVWEVFDNEPEAHDSYGGIASKVGNVRPRFYRSQPSSATTVTYPYVPGPHGLLENGHLIYDWDSGQLTTSFYQDPEDAGMISVYHFFAGGALFWEMNSSLTNRVKVWTPQAGVQTLLTQGDDIHSGVGGFCTDGTDMMWALAEERPAKNESYEKISLYTAKFASDPNALQPHRLRSDFPGTIVFEQCALGCGFAARETYEDLSVGKAGVRVVRLSDGWSWMLTYDTASVDKWMWVNPIALTCDELFISVKTPSWNIARVRLDSLGPGEPPD